MSIIAIQSPGHHTNRYLKMGQQYTYLCFFFFALAPDRACPNTSTVFILVFTLRLFTDVRAGQIFEISNCVRKNNCQGFAQVKEDALCFAIYIFHKMQLFCVTHRSQRNSYNRPF